MPIDPSIPLAARPMALVDPTQAMTQALTLREMGQRSAYNDARLRQQQMEDEQNRRALEDDEALRTTVQRHAQQGGAPDYDAIAADLDAQGRPGASMKVRAAVTEQRKKAADAAQTNLENGVKAVSFMSNLLRGVSDDAGYQQVRPQVVSMLGEHATMLPEVYDKPAIDRLVEQGLDAQERLERMRQANERIKNGPKTAQDWMGAAGQALSAAADAASWGQIRGGLQTLGAPAEVLAMFPVEFSPEAVGQAGQLAMTPEQRASAGATAATRTETARHNRVMEAQGAQRLANENGSQPRVTGLIGEKALEGVDPGMASVVKQLTDYRIPLPSGMALRTPYWQRVLELAAAYDPTFDATQYGVRLAARKDFTQGKAAKNILSLNTAIRHLETLQKASDGLQNRGLTPWNSVVNTVQSKAGASRVVRFVTAANAVENELAALFKGTGATDQEIKAWRGSFNENMSPEQLRVSITQAVELMGGRLAALQGQYQQAMGKPAAFTMLNKKSRETLTRMGIDPATVETTDVAPATQAGPTKPVAASGGTAPAAQPSVQPTSAQRADMNQGPGRYELDDGSVWTLDAAGRYTPERAAPSKPAAPVPSKPAPGTVKMKAPDGTVRDVPQALVEHYRGLGAVVVR